VVLIEFICAINKQLTTTDKLTKPGHRKTPWDVQVGVSAVTVSTVGYRISFQVDIRFITWNYQHHLQITRNNAEKSLYDYNKYFSLV